MSNPVGAPAAGFDGAAGVSEAEQTPGAAESTGCTLGISLTLVALVLSILGVFGLLSAPQLLEGELDTQQVLAETFKQPVAPFGLVEAGAKDFRKRAKVLRLARPGLDESRGAQEAALEARLIEAQEGAPYSGAAGQRGSAAEEAKRRELLKDAKPMAALEVLPGSVDPEELILISFEKTKQLIAVFKPSSMGSQGFGGPMEESDTDVGRKLEAWKQSACYSWKTTLMRDKIRWQGWEADFHLDRSFRAGGAWQDSVKLNLGLGARNLAIFVRWPDGYEVTREDIRRVTSLVRMQSGLDEQES